MLSLNKSPFKTTKKFRPLVFVTFLLLVFTSQTAIAAASLAKMRIGQTSDKTRVVFDLKQAYKYQLTELSNPSRLVVDFFNTSNNLSFSRKHVTDSRLFKIRVSEKGKRTRVVLDLHKTPVYDSFLLAKDSNGKARLVVDLLDKKKAAKPHIKQPQSKTIKKANNALKPKIIHTPKQVTKAEITSVKEPQPTKPQLKNEKVLIEKAANSQVAKASPVKVEKHKTALAKKTKESKHVAASKAVQSNTTLKETPNAITNAKETSLLAQAKITKTAKPRPLVAMADKKPAQQKQLNNATQKLLNKSSDVLTKPAELVVAIDAGHGGKDTGAVGHNKVYEKHATLMMARELKKIIDKQPGMKAVLTRDKDVFLRLSQRVEIAKKKQADIFISIHADAFHDHSVRGGSVYVLSERGASSTMAKLLAKSENSALEDISLASLDKDVAFALSDLSREANVKASRKLAKTVLKEMRKTVRMHKNSVQSAGFAVLKSIDMPSLLIETAFISNPYEAKNLMSRNFQRKMASAIVDGLNQYAAALAPKQRWGESLYVEYQVQKGDTLSQIAESYQVTTKALKKINKIKNANSLYVGKKLKIPVADNLLAGLS